MPKPLPRLLAIGVAAATGLALSPAPASAAPAFTDAYLNQYLNTSIYNAGSSPACTSTTSLPSSPGKEIPENGAVVTGAAGGSQSWKSNSDAGNTAAVAAAVSGSAKATGTGAAPRSIELSFSGQASMTTSKPAGFACTMRATASLDAWFEFTTATPLIATVTYQRTGNAMTSTSIYSDADPSEDIYGDGFPGGGVSTIYLPAGRYSGGISGGIYLPRTKARSQAAGAGSVRISFVVPGSAIAGPRGKARKLVTLPAGRSCAAHVVAPQLTTKAKRLKKVAKVSFTVNGKKSKTVKGKKLKKGKAVPIGIADKATAKVGVTVTLKNGRKVTAKATYHPCA